ncbi:hypothetical protein PspLS_00483 [Pyricularia sp. CBS 133598]|nr:hypothetical protein PspLS_00483 [Pyricularia sp. CBS 133598]
MESSNKVALVVGASRGIGRQIALDLARNKYKVVVAAKSISDTTKAVPFPPNPNSPDSTINTVEREIRTGGGDATAVQVDTRDVGSVQRLVEQTIELYGRIDVLIYNSGAIWWASVADTPMKRFQLMQRVNPEGLYATIQATLPHMTKQGQGRIIVVSPPIYSRFFRGKTAYAMGKIAMSVLTKGLAMDLERQGLNEMAITSLWPAVAIESAATEAFTQQNPDEAKDLRKPTIFSDAILEILRAPVKVVNGMLGIDEDFLRDHAGVTDFSAYSVVAGAQPRRIMPVNLPDITVAEQGDEGRRYDSSQATKGKSKI